MQLPLAGGCQCSKLGYEISEVPRLVYTCHCTDCQRMTSSAFSMGVVLADRAFRITTATEPRPVKRTTDSGRVTIRWLCPDCGSWISGTPRLGAPVRTVAGRHARRHFVVAADGASMDPQQAPWITLPVGDRSFETQPTDMAAFWTSAVVNLSSR
jgi:hypothetical protein